MLYSHKSSVVITNTWGGNKKNNEIDIKSHVSGFKENSNTWDLELNLYGNRLSSIPIFIYSGIFLSQIYILWLSQGQIIVFDKLWLWCSMSFTVLRPHTKMFICFLYSCNHFLNLLRHCGRWYQEKQKNEFPWIVVKCPGHGGQFEGHVLCQTLRTVFSFSASELITSLAGTF